MSHQTALKQGDWVDRALGDLPPICTTAEALGVLRICKRQLYRLTASGRIRSFRRVHSGSSRLMIPRDALAEYLRSLEVAA